MARHLSRKSRPEFRQDLVALSSENLQRRAIQIFLDLSRREFEGPRLGYRASIGDLSDCRKVYFDVIDGRAPRYRFVYRLLPNEDHAAEIEALGVGQRQDLAIYLEVARRLGRLPDD